MDQRRRQSSFSFDEPLAESPDPDVTSGPGLSDDEAFEALAASMSLFAPLLPDVSNSGDDDRLRPEPPETATDLSSDMTSDVDSDIAGDADSDIASASTSDVTGDQNITAMPVLEIPEQAAVEALEAACQKPLPAAHVGPLPEELPALEPFDGGSQVAHSSQGWLDPMAFNRDADDALTGQPGRIEPPDFVGASVDVTADEDLGVFGTSSGADVDNSFHDIVTIGLLTGEISTDFIAAAQRTEGAAAVSSIGSDEYPEAGRWWRPTTLDEFQSVIETYLQPVAAVSASLVQRPELLDDVVAKTFLSAWVEGREGVPSEPIESWLYSISLDVVRQKDRHHRRLGAVANTRYPAPAHRGSEELRQAHARATWEICLALGELDDLERTVLRLSHHGGLLHTEIAAETHSSLGAVKSCVYRASSHLISRLSHRLEVEDDAEVDPDVDSGDVEPIEDLDEVVADSRVDHTWYLAGIADGASLSAIDRRVIKDLRAQLAAEYVWRAPTRGLAEAIVAAAADNEGTLTPRRDPQGDGGHLAGGPQADTLPSSPDWGAATSPAPQAQPTPIAETGSHDVVASPSIDRPTAQASTTGGVAGLVRTTVQYDPEVAKERPISRLRRVVHPLKAGPSRGQTRPRQAPQSTDIRKIRRSPEAATAPVPIQPAPQPEDFIADEQAGVGNHEETPRSGSVTAGSAQAAAVSHGKVAALAIGVIVLAAAIILAPYVLGSGPTETDTLDFELNATAADPDATAVATVSQLGSETMYRLWLGGLNPTGDQHFYAAWLVDPNTVVDGAVAMAEAQVLGSFRWTVNGQPIVLGLDGVEPRFDHLIVTLQGPTDPPGPSGVVVLEGSVRAPGS